VSTQTKKYQIAQAATTGSHLLTIPQGVYTHHVCSISDIVVAAVNGKEYLRGQASVHLLPTTISIS
jgi:hypothetical protein